MSSVLRITARRKKKRMGKPEIMSRAEYQEQPVDVRVELLRALIPLGLIAVHEEIDAEVTRLAGVRYARKAPEIECGRHVSDP